MSESDNPMKTAFHELRLPEGCTLKRKETYEYTTPNYTYDVELFEHSDGTFYSIGVPRDAKQVVVYGSSIVPKAEQALQILIDKIRRESMETLFDNRFSEEYTDDED